MKRVINYTLNQNKGIVIRIDDTAVEKVMVWALGDGEEKDVRETIAYWCGTITAAGGKNAAYHKNLNENIYIFLVPASLSRPAYLNVLKVNDLALRGLKKRQIVLISTIKGRSNAMLILIRTIF